MPVYEYACLDCGQPFEALRKMADSDVPIACAHCHGDRTTRQLSVFFAQSGGRALSGTSQSCGACSGGSCSTCGH
ncbi:MAG: zinc ribbon domain-containing protein [Anaerolineales bacterium]|nr:zinc ribbon domain-containing protein [Anaerolineales bacterium]